MYKTSKVLLSHIDEYNSSHHLTLLFNTKSYCSQLSITFNLHKYSLGSGDPSEEMSCHTKFLTNVFSCPFLKLLLLFFFLIKMNLCRLADLLFSVFFFISFFFFFIFIFFLHFGKITKQ